MLARIRHKHYIILLVSSCVLIYLIYNTLKYDIVTSDRSVVLVTGAAGLVGSHLCEELLKRNYIVYGLDNLSTGQIRNINWLNSLRDFYFVNRDVTDKWEDGFTRLDEIYHMASPASPKAYFKDPIGTYRANTIGTESMIELAGRHSARLLFASSSEVYGDPLTHPQTEIYWGNVNPYGPRACYDESKRMGETLCFIAQQLYGTEIRIARIFNTFGPRMHPEDGRVISNFIMNGIKGDDIFIYGDGMKTRSFMYISDLVDGLIRLMASNNSSPINLGNPYEEHNVLKVAKIIQELLAERGIARTRINYIQALQDDPTKRKPDISKAEELLDWRPTVSFEDGLRKTIDYFIELYK
ncbi:hypothetical protein LOD99_4424 [Oopsacas minuta]|uniref:UDP-glucuronic acid decarboxylase 1 n=1 Tax=Oopsacas minuta TaxID=111878 RepID=A0AAV7JVJ7_9METZ|nr:hypothetical protein LOD99_4424 [Oopsacas minuta]